MSSEPPAKVAKMTNSDLDNANTIPTDKSIAELKKEGKQRYLYFGSLLSLCSALKKIVLV